jgi:hypothetical protein
MGSCERAILRRGKRDIKNSLGALWNYLINTVIKKRGMANDGE